jgi:hypothetical protein
MHRRCVSTEDRWSSMCGLKDSTHLMSLLLARRWGSVLWGAVGLNEACLLSSRLETCCGTTLKSHVQYSFQVGPIGSATITAFWILLLGFTRRTTLHIEDLPTISAHGNTDLHSHSLDSNFPNFPTLRCDFVFGPSQLGDVSVHLTSYSTLERHLQSGKHRHVGTPLLEAFCDASMEPGLQSGIGCQSLRPRSHGTDILASHLSTPRRKRHGRYLL